MHNLTMMVREGRADSFDCPACKRSVYVRNANRKPRGWVLTCDGQGHGWMTEKEFEEASVVPHHDLHTDTGPYEE